MTERPEIDQLNEEEREKLLMEAMSCPTGHAIQGLWMQSLALKRWFPDVDREQLLEARREAPDGGMEASQKALNEMEPEERSEVLDEVQSRFVTACGEALDQLEFLTIGLWEDPREKLDGDLIATLAGTPIVANNRRLRT